MFVVSLFGLFVDLWCIVTTYILSADFNIMNFFRNIGEEYKRW